MKCWNCGNILPDPDWGKIPFRAECDDCGADLHCCVNCKFYKPGAPNNCLVPGTDYVSDREARNLCEEFSLLGIGPAKKRPNPQDITKRLFKDENPQDSSKKSFDSLFSDD